MIFQEFEITINIKTRANKKMTSKDFKLMFDGIEICDGYKGINIYESNFKIKEVKEITENVKKLTR